LAGERVSTLPRIECWFAVEFHWMFKGRDVTMPQVAAKSRGKGSRSNIKPSFKIEFNRYESQNNFLGLKELVLRANTQDASSMHDRVAMEFFRKLGIAAPREVHTRLYINDQYAGLYTIGEDVDPDFLQRYFGESEGRLYSYEWVDPWTFDYRGPDPSKYSPLPLQPETNLIHLDPAPIEAMVRTINQAPDAQFSAAVSQYIDLNALFRELAAENFLADQDSIIGDYALNNFFLYRFQNNIRSIFIPWDKSNAFWAMDWNIFHNFTTNVLTRRALAVAPELIALYKDTLRQAANIAGGVGGWLEQEIMKEYQQIRQAAYEDTNKLCDQGATGYLHPCSNDEFDAEVAYMIRFARQRAANVQAQLASSPQ
jgi:spore coat protein CotH